MNSALDAEERLRQAVRGWIDADRPQVSVAERLQRLHAAQARSEKQNAPAVRVWSRAPAQQKSWRWLAAAAAVALVAVSWGVARQMAPEMQPLQNDVATTIALPPPRPSLARVTAAQGLYRCSTPGSRRWSSLAIGGELQGGDLIQAAFEKGGGEAELFQKHRVKLHPGAIVRLGDDPMQPQIDLWYGTIEIWANDAVVRVVSRAGDQSFSASVGQHATASVETLATAAQFDLEGFTLFDDAALPAARITHFNSVAPPIELGDGSANLLTVITVNMQQQPLSEAVGMLRDALTLRIVLSPAAEAKLGTTAMTLNAGQVSGGEAIAKLAEAAGLVMKVRDGEIALELPNEPKPKTTKPQDF